MQRPCVSFCSASPSPRGSRGPGASTQAGPRGRMGRKACGNLRRLPLFLRVHFSSLSLRPNGSLAHKNNTNPSADVERDGGEAWSSLVPRLVGGRGGPPSSVSSSPASASCGRSSRAASVTCTHHAQSAWLPHSGVLPAVFPEVITGH